MTDELRRVVPLVGFLDDAGVAGARPYLIVSSPPPAGSPPGPSADQSDSLAWVGPPHKFPQARAVEFDCMKDVLEHSASE